MTQTASEAAAPYVRVLDGRVCRRCGEDRLDLMVKRRDMKNGHDLLCRPCDHLRRKKPRTPEQEFARRAGRYGLAPVELREMLDSREGVCDMCGCVGVKGTLGVLHIDHCHMTGEVRGMLCINCNMRLGFLENPELRAQAERYLGGAL